MADNKNINNIYNLSGKQISSMQCSQVMINTKKKHIQIHETIIMVIYLFINLMSQLFIH